MHLTIFSTKEIPLKYLSMENTFSDCQIACLVCRGKDDLLDTNFSELHKICSYCRYKQDTDALRQCVHCMSSVKVFKAFLATENDSSTFFQSKNPQPSPKHVSIKTSFLSSLDRSNPSSPLNSTKPVFFSCEHSFCIDCKENKLDGCFICKVNENKFKCAECDSSSGLNRAGDYWRCKRNTLHLTSICYACKTASKFIEESNKCMLCNCLKSSAIICRKQGHQFCGNCIDKLGVMTGCYVCEHPEEYRCKRCGTYDIFCKNSICPYCSLHEQHPAYCLYCLSDLKS